MGRIITFKAPAYYSSSRSVSPADDDSDVDPISTPCRITEGPLYNKTVRPDYKVSKRTNLASEI